MRGRAGYTGRKGSLTSFVPLTDPCTQTKGNEIAKEFQRLTLDMDKPAKQKDWKSFLQAHAQGSQYYQSFIEILSDVPDEL